MFGAARIEDQRTPLFTVSVDLVAAEEVVHRRGPIADAVALSVRLPGIVPPQRVGDRLHVDGGVLDNLPIGVMAAEGEGPVLAVDVAQPFGEGAAAALPHIVDTVGRAMTIGSWRRDDPARALAREVIVPDLGDIGLFDFRRLDELVERGARGGPGRGGAAHRPQGDTTNRTLTNDTDRCGGCAAARATVAAIDGRGQAASPPNDGRSAHRVRRGERRPAHIGERDPAAHGGGERPRVVREERRGLGAGVRPGAGVPR